MIFAFEASSLAKLGKKCCANVSGFANQPAKLTTKCSETVKCQEGKKGLGQEKRTT
jgi:hypothetical protein